MTDDKLPVLPQWAPRVAKPKIERMYTRCASGIFDEEIIDEVGYSLYARCESMLEVNEITRTSQARCPVCATVLPKRTWEYDEMLLCPQCDWTCTPKMYSKTFSRKNLGTGGLDTYVIEFMRRFKISRSYAEKIILIDTLIHRFHWASEQGRPLATALIEGNMKGTVAFLDRLTYGDSVPEDVHQTRENWRKIWKVNGWSKGRGQ